MAHGDSMKWIANSAQNGNDSSECMLNDFSLQTPSLAVLRQGFAFHRLLNYSLCADF